MSKAKTGETPTETVAKRDVASHTDERGRLITVHRLNALQFYRLTKVMGGSSTNAATMDLAIIASSVKKIDATPVALPANESDIEFLIQTLDFDGIAAAGEALKKLNQNEDEAIEVAKN